MIGATADSGGTTYSDPFGASGPGGTAPFLVLVRSGRHDGRAELREQPAAVSGGDTSGQLKDSQVR